MEEVVKKMGVVETYRCKGEEVMGMGVGVVETCRHKVEVVRD